MLLAKSKSIGNMYSEATILSYNKLITNDNDKSNSTEVNTTTNQTK